MLGRKPVIPHSAAGTRTEPPVSVPSPAGTIAASMAAAVPPDDPPARWPEEDRQSVPLGTLEIGALEVDATCDATMFDPTNLPKGIAGPDKDQLVPARTPAYAVSFSKRAN